MTAVLALALLMLAVALANAYVAVREIRSGVASLRRGDQETHRYDRRAEPEKFWLFVVLVRFAPVAATIFYAFWIIAHQ
ncbi:hypothetical protein ACLB0R_03235 [Sphingomonas sp. GlSt437]|uniref:hypothetical protein n=1 Tax=Sphingomonas sp. GlSt437 TaxID=3389970 RepID=UPI003A88BE8E